MNNPQLNNCSSCAAPNTASTFCGNCGSKFENSTPIRDYSQPPEEKSWIQKNLALFIVLVVSVPFVSLFSLGFIGGFVAATAHRLAQPQQIESIAANHTKPPEQDQSVSNSSAQTISNSNRLLPAPTGFVNDFADILDSKTKEKLEQTLTNFKTEAKIDFVIATVKTTGGKSAFDYSLKAANEWDVGSQNPDQAGVFLLIAVEDRHWHIQITRILEKFLSNAEVGELGAVMRPHFRKQKFNEGVTKCVEAFIKTLKEKRGIR